jgi:hypothetical protein
MCVDFNARPIDDVVDTHSIKQLTISSAQPNSYVSMT